MVIRVRMSSSGGARVPELVAGDRLTREEFERRYAATPGLFKAELIEGVVYVPSPVRHVQHGRPHALLVAWLAHYEAATPGVQVSGNATVRLDGSNVPQPDVLLFLPRELGGQARVDADGYLSGPPELAAEVTASTASYDLHDKKRAFQRNGVREYLAWRTEDRALDWFSLRGRRYRSLTADATGILRSQVFPGLWLDRPALVRRDLASVLRTLALGLGSREHAAFVARLGRRG